MAKHYATWLLTPQSKVLKTAIIKHASDADYQDAANQTLKIN